jgi:hypothetical protein
MVVDVILQWSDVLVGAVTTLAVIALIGFIKRNRDPW